MKMVLGLASCGCLAALAFGVAGAGDDKKFDATKLVGEWKYAEATKKGEKLDADKLKKETVTITKENLTIQGEAKFVMKYELDTAKKPVGVKFTITESPFGAGMTANGIIELNGDTLKICYDAEGGAAPKTFESKADSKHHYFVLKRVKKDN